MNTETTDTGARSCNLRTINFPAGKACVCPNSSACYIFAKTCILRVAGTCELQPRTREMGKLMEYVGDDAVDLMFSQARMQGRV